MKNYELHHGDCLDVMKTMPDKSVDLVLTDPPYGIGKVWSKGSTNHGWGNSNKQRGLRNEWDDKPPKKEVFDKIAMVSKNQIIWGGNYFDLPISRCWLVWNKPERGFSLAEAELAWTSFDKIVRVIDCHRSDTNRLHPTQKPLDVMKYCVSNYSKKGDIILDPFMGSGTTGVACVLTGRKFIGIEKEPKYFEIAKQRIEAATKGITVKELKTGQESLFENH